MAVKRKEAKRLEWDALIKEYKASGLSAEKWCYGKGYRKSQLYWQIRKRRDSEEPGEPATQWISLMAESAVEVSGIKVKIGSAEIIIVNGFDAELLCEVIRALKNVC